MNRQWVIRIHQPDEWLTANRTPHWAARNRMVQTWRHAAYFAARQTRPRIPTGLELVRVEVLFRWGKAPVRDLPNITPTIKVCVDGAVGPSRRTKTGSTALGYGIVPDDSDNHLVLAAPRAELVKGLVRGQVVLTVVDLSPIPVEPPAVAA